MLTMSTKLIDGQSYQNIRKSDQQGSDQNTFIGCTLQKPYEEVIIKCYEQQNNEKLLDVISKIRQQQIDIKPKCQHIIKILGIDNPQSNEEKKFYVVYEKGKDNVQNLLISDSFKSKSSSFKLNCFKQMLQGVQEMHNLKFMHRDLKPENFVYFENEKQKITIKLIDFGSSKTNDYLQQTQVGTWKYMAPEVVEIKKYDKNADIWSLGIILYEILTNQDFIQANGQKEVIRYISNLNQEKINQDINQNNDKNNFEKSLLLKMLQKDAQKRAQAEDLIQYIEQQEMQQKKMDEQTEPYNQRLLEKERELEKQEQEKQRELKKQKEFEIQKKLEEQGELELQKELEKKQQLEENKQSILVLLQTHQYAIQMFIQNLEQKQQVIKDIDLSNDQKSRLIEDINIQLQKYNKKLQIYQEKQTEVQIASQQDQLKGFNNQLTQEIQQDRQEQITIIQTIQEQQTSLQKQMGDKQKLEEQQKEEQRRQEQEKQLEIERKNFQEKFGNFKQQFDQQIRNINIIQETIRFYESVQYQIQEKPKITEVLLQHQRIQQELQVLEQQEKNLNQVEKSQQLANYQSLQIKIQESQQALIRHKNQIDETNKYIEQINSKFAQEHQIQINVIADNLNDYQDKFKYLSQNQKYANKIQQISSQIESSFGLLNNINSLLQQGIFLNYQKFNQTKDSITQNLQDFEKQHNLLVEQIHNDQQVEQRNTERLKKLEIIEGQLNEFIKKMNQLKNQINNFSKNQYCNDEQTRNLILDKQLKIDQNIESFKQQYQNFQKFNLLISFDTINTQINLLEQFQSKLFQILQDEQEKVLQLDYIIQQISIKNKSVQEKEYLELNNQLQKLQMQFQRSFQQIKLDQDKFDNSKLMNAKTDELKQQLEQEIITIDNYYKINQDNQQLFQEYFKKYQNKQQLYQILNRLSNYNKDKTVKLDEVYQNAHNQFLQLQFKPLTISLIDNYKQLQQQGEQLSQDINLIDQMAQNQQQNTSSFNQLKERMQKLINNLESLISIIPQNYEIEEFNSIYKHNLESFLKLYSLINYLKQYHLTRYYERIKENARKNKNKENQKDNSYIIVFQQRQNEVMEEDTRKEKEAQNLLKIYENILYHNLNQKMIEELQKDNEQISKSIEQVENQIKLKNQVKLKGKVKNLESIKEIINTKQYYKITEFAQMIIFRIIYQRF